MCRICISQCDAIEKKHLKMSSIFALLSKWFGLCGLRSLLPFSCYSNMYKYIIPSVGHPFGLVKFWIFVVVFCRQALGKNQNKNSKFDAFKSMSCLGKNIVLWKHEYETRKKSLPTAILLKWFMWAWMKLMWDIRNKSFFAYVASKHASNYLAKL